MIVPVVVLLLLLVLLVVGGVAAIVLGRRAVRREHARRTSASAPGMREVPRLHAEVHTGWEQTLIGLTRELHLPASTDDLPYGALYAERRTDRRQYLRTRSELGRGFIGVLEITPHDGPTTVDYAILRLPVDEQLHTRVATFELDLIAALHRIDRDAVVRIDGDGSIPPKSGRPSS